MRRAERRTAGGLRAGLGLLALLAFLCAVPAAAQTGAPDGSGSVSRPPRTLAPEPDPGPLLGFVEPAELTTSIKLILFFTGLTLLPALVVSVTCFTRVLVVLSMLRQAIGVQQPPGPVIVALSVMLSIFIMMPTLSGMQRDAIGPYLDGKITDHELVDRGAKPLRQFMLGHVRQKDLALFIQMARLERPATVADVPFAVIVPAFMISELRTAFEMGFMLFLPFLVVDMVVASVLMSMGMMMLPPVVVSLPFKILLFVLVDGWNLVVRGLVSSFA